MMRCGKIPENMALRNRGRAHSNALPDELPRNAQQFPQRSHEEVQANK